MYIYTPSIMEFIEYMESYVPQTYYCIHTLYSFDSVLFGCYVQLQHTII